MKYEDDSYIHFVHCNWQRVCLLTIARTPFNFLMPENSVDAPIIEVNNCNVHAFFILIDIIIDTHFSHLVSDLLMRLLLAV